MKIEDQLILLGINKKKNVTVKFQYTYACPKDSCKGFLNDDNIHNKDFELTSVDKNIGE